MNSRREKRRKDVQRDAPQKSRQRQEGEVISDEGTSRGRFFQMYELLRNGAIKTAAKHQKAKRGGFGRDSSAEGPL